MSLLSALCLTYAKHLIFADISLSVFSYRITFRCSQKDHIFLLIWLRIDIKDYPIAIWLCCRQSFDPTFLPAIIPLIFAAVWFCCQKSSKSTLLPATFPSNFPASNTYHPTLPPAIFQLFCGEFNLERCLKTNVCAKPLQLWTRLGGWQPMLQLPPTWCCFCLVTN